MTFRNVAKLRTSELPTSVKQFDYPKRMRSAYAPIYIQA